jgi:hypothetical protein
MIKWLKQNLLILSLIALVLLAGAGRYSDAIRLIGGPNKTPVVVESNGGLAVNVQDQDTPPVDLFFTNPIGVPTALTNAVAINDTSFDVDSVANISVGNYLGIFSGTSAEGRFLFAEVLTVVSNTVTIDTPIDFAFSAGDPVISTSREMNVNGAITAQTFSVTNGSTSSVITIDITRIMFSMTLGTAGDDGKFGNITSLTNGIVFRRTNGDIRNVFNVKNNGELRALCFDLTYPIRSGGGGDFGMGARYTFAGQDKHGVVLRLHPGDSLDVIIQDDLTGLSSYRMVAPGHITFE